jgi:tetrahydromethanopterin S-methyltransferase subunit C
LWEVDVPRTVTGGQNVLAALNINSDAVIEIIMGFGTGVTSLIMTSLSLGYMGHWFKRSSSRGSFEKMNKMTLKVE